MEHHGPVIWWILQYHLPRKAFRTLKARIIYLIPVKSFYPQGLRESFIFGGLQPLVKGPDEVYRRLYKKVIQRNEAYYRKYPEDVERVKLIVRYLQRFGDGKIKLPSEGNLSVRRFQQMGINFGFHGRSHLVQMQMVA